MLALLLHSLFYTSTAAGNDEDKSAPEEAKKAYNVICRKLRREIGERGPKELQKLLPPPKRMVEILQWEVYGSRRTPGQTQSSKPGSSGLSLEAPIRPGVQPVQKVSVSPWDIIEVRPNYSLVNQPGNASSTASQPGLQWSYFHSIRVDSTPESMTSQLARTSLHEHWRKMKRNTFPGQAESNPFLEPIQVPIDPNAVAEDEEKSMTAGFDANSPRTRGAGIKRQASRTSVLTGQPQRKTSRPMMNPMTPMGTGGYPQYGNQIMHPGPGQVNFPVASATPEMVYHQPAPPQYGTGAGSAPGGSMAGRFPTSMSMARKALLAQHQQRTGMVPPPEQQSEIFWRYEYSISCFYFYLSIIFQ